CLNTDDPPIFTDSSSNSKSIAAVGIKKLLWYKSGSTFTQKVETRSNFLTAGITPGGNYLIYNTYIEHLPYRIFKIFSQDKQDLTPLSQKQQEELNKKDDDVVYVAANNKGIFYAVLNKKTLKFYQVGKYEKDYQEEKTKEEINTRINNLFQIENGKYLPVDVSYFENLSLGKIYYAKKDLDLNFGKNIGSLKITRGTYFAINGNKNLILLKGQIIADFNSPWQIYAIKFDRFDLDIFQEKLDKFLNRSLPEEEYFLIENLGTKFLVKNELNKINIAVEKGEIKVKGKNLEEKINNNNQITIDKNNKVEKSKYYGEKIYGILILLILVISLILLFIYRTTKQGKLVLKILRKTLEIVFWIIKKIVLFLSSLIKTIIKLLIKKQKKK
ncbi:MAG: hypothetical protein N2Z85_01670, partial [Patescibacteria group bacterium]|nr:hypothetical protein [Patescibacteria group bacterium]